MDIKDLRKEINEIDREIAGLFERRMIVSAGIAGYKRENGLPVFDPEREKEVILRNSGYISDENIRSFYVPFQRSVMDVSKQYQASLIDGYRIAYPGTVGAFSHIAAKKIFGSGIFVPCQGFETAFRSVENGESDVCVLPIENSYAGEVAQVNDLLFRGSLYISGVYDLAVDQCLCGIKGATVDDVKRVVSHSQALSQCADFISEHGYDVIQYENTATAAEYVASLGDIGTAAICSEECADIFSLSVICRKINTAANNTTRFVVLTRAKPVPGDKRTGDVRFTLMFTVKNETGALAEVISSIAGLGYNMTSIHSAPMKELPWNYYFRIECEGEPDASDYVKMMSNLSCFGSGVRLIGIYSVRKLN